MKCHESNGTYRCEKPYQHDGPHACYVMSGKATWAHMYDGARITRVKL